MSVFNDDDQLEVVFLPEGYMDIFMEDDPRTPPPEVPPIEVPGREDAPERIPAKGKANGRANLQLVKG